ncbi:choice-of-anchor tandem repeat GloVer-containing protein [Lutibacter oceani]|uniref:choice-of-anchor tandem repeat GloVer-containing protein n=1 Tax=Lutibacter oceani TaxID=1853311 RepID=UPI0013C2DBC9|nr:choice-of-anchor tandem repeat GloVer-containing protein [Lutibacter oceani]
MITIRKLDNNVPIYAVYSNKDNEFDDPIECEVNSSSLIEVDEDSRLVRKQVSNYSFRTLRLAIATTGEFSQYHLNRLGIDSQANDTAKIEAVMSSLVSLLTKINAIFERDVGVRFILVSETEQLISLDSENDGLDDSNRYDLLNKSTDYINERIGSDVYDIGHVFGNSDVGGVAWLNSACTQHYKGGGVSGSSLPDRDYFVKLVLHELGHQLGANHTFNGNLGSCEFNGNYKTGVEPGSGTTLMSYAGNCQFQNLQTEKDMYFHYVSIQEMRTFFEESGCGNVVEVNNNNPPIIEDLLSYIIPISTPFKLDAEIFDPNDDAIMVSWEQIDTGLKYPVPESTNTGGPLFRSVYPSGSSERFFPNKTTLSNGQISNRWEVLPEVARSMKFGLTVRDNNLIAPLQSFDEVEIVVTDKAGPFKITSQFTSEVLSGSKLRVNWSVANTDSSPINCKKVNILLSTDGGTSYPYQLKLNTDNDGEEEVIVPEVSSSGVKIKVESVENIFFTVNIGYIKINSNPELTFIPDDNFESALISLGVDNILDNYVERSKIETITKLDIKNKEIENITGIEDFKTLSQFDCSNNKISKLDFSGNPNLYYLNFNENHVSEIDVSKNSKLEHISGYFNDLDELDLKNCHILKTLNLSENKLQNLDISKNEQLKNLLVGTFTNRNQINELNIEMNSELIWISIYGNKLTQLNLNNNPQVKSVDAFSNHLSELNLLNSGYLEYLDISSNKIEDLDISNCTNLNYLSVDNNDIRSIDFSSNKKLESLKISNNSLGQLDVSENKLIKELTCRYNNLVCIGVNESQLFGSSKIWIKDENATYSLYCDEDVYVDTDSDGVYDHMDLCPETNLGELVNEYGCNELQWDADNDGVPLDRDYCLDSKPGEETNELGCSKSAVNVLGVNSYGGEFRQGVVFDLDIEKMEVSKLVDMNQSYGIEPIGELLKASNGKIYGVTDMGGNEHTGTLFEYDPSNQSFQVRYHFSWAMRQPNGYLTEVNKKLYGCVTRGANNLGAIFEFDYVTGEMVIIHDFEDKGTGGVSIPMGRLNYLDGKLYGVAYGGEYYEDNKGNGVIFDFDLETKKYTPRYHFNSLVSGSINRGGMVLAENKKLYGATWLNGENCDGVLFEYDPYLNHFKALHHFDYDIEGKNPNTYLELGRNQKIYGMTHYGGESGNGTIFEYNYMRNKLKKIYEFDLELTRWVPYTKMLHAKNGKFYFLNTSDRYDQYSTVNLFEFDPGNKSIKKTTLQHLAGNSGFLIEKEDDDNDGVMNNIDLCPNTPAGEEVSASGCSESQLDDDGDGVMNNIDTCPDTPTGEEVNATGCSESQLDNDGDGIMNNADLCPNTLTGTNVNENGCFFLPSDNFTFEVISETCPNKNNGQISITAVETHNYLATLNGNSHNFSNNSLTVSNMQPGTYEVCITVSGETFEQCYTIEIAEGTTVSGKASVTSNKASIAIEKGTAPYNVLVNGKNVLNTFSTSIEVDVKHGDLIEVKTAVLCEGVFSKNIDLFETVTVYPNPTNGIFEITLPILLNEIKIELFTSNSQLISTKTYSVINGKVQLNIENMPAAVYFAKVYLENPISVKIIKE